MEDEVLGAEGEGAFDFAAEGLRRVDADGLGLAAEVDEIAGVDGDGADVVLGAQGEHFGGVLGLDGRGLPGAWAGGKYLEGVGAGLDRAIDGGPDAAGGADVDAYALAYIHEVKANSSQKVRAAQCMILAMAKPQSFQNHTRFDPPFHFFVLPLLLINFVLAIWYTIRHWPLHSKAGIWWILMSFVAFLAVGKSRSYALKAQDRIIRLEERLRLLALVPEKDKAIVAKLTEEQFIALRFADDDELPTLAVKAVEENLTRKQIKAAIEKWRPDYFRV